MEKDVKVNVDVVPIEDIGSLWIITGEESEVNRALVYLNSIYQNTIIKTGKSKEVSIPGRQEPQDED